MPAMHDAGLGRAHVLGAQLRRGIFDGWSGSWWSGLQQILLVPAVDTRRVVVRCALAALILLVAAYPDVIFRRASVSLANYMNVTIQPAREKVQIFPERDGREAYHGYYDSAGGAFQSEPSAQFMKRAFWNNQSIYWNPYSATGSLGPETLVDVKTSPVSIVVALLGGSDAVFHLAYLGFSLLGVFCLLVLLTVEFRLSLLAAVFGGITYLLNGFNVANLGSNVSQTWLYFPVFALGLVSFANRPRVLSFLGTTAGAILLLSTTFLPTTIVITGTTLLVGAAAAIGFAFAREERWQAALSRAVRTVGGQIAAVLFAGLILAVVYLPIYEALRYMATGEYYGNRHFFPAALFNFISLFTPKHAFEAYNAISPRANALRGNVAYHQGIISALLATQSLRAWPLFHRILLGTIWALLILALARVYGAPGISEVIDILPLVGNIGEQYLWAAVAILFTLAVPFGADAVLRSGLRVWPLMLCAALIIAALAYTTRIDGIENAVALRYIAIAGALVALMVLILLNFHRPAFRLAPALLLVILFWGELTFYVDHFRYARTDRFSDPPPFVRFLQMRDGLHRVASYGYWGIPPEYGSAYGIYQIGSMNFHIFPRYEDLFNRLIVSDPADRWTGFVTLVRARDTDSLNLRALDLLGAAYVTVPSTYTRLRGFMEHSQWTRVYQDPYFLIFENQHPLPRAFITHRLLEDRTTPVDLDESPLALATSDDAVLLEQARGLGLTDTNAADRKDDLAAITRYDNAAVEIVTSSVAPGVLVLTDAWHPSWKASVDGQPAYLGIVDEAFRGVVLPSGRHTVEMTYAPRTLGAASVISLLGLLLAGALLALRHRLDPIFLRFFTTHAGREAPHKSMQGII
jgi:hypothetical protein